MIRCPSCATEHEDDALVCVACGSTLAGGGSASSDDAASDDVAHLEDVTVLHADAMPSSSDGASRGAGPAEARLGTFHPLVARQVGAVLARKGVTHTTIERDDEVELRVEVSWRDEVRTELMLSWTDLVGALDPEDAAAVRATGGSAPGWFDAPRGGHIDREGHLVVASDDEEARVVGPAMLTFGSILAIIGWYAMDSTAVLTLGVGLVLLGLFTPR